MDCVILAAGFGTRIREIAENRPKTLLKVAGRSLLERHVILLTRYGVKRFVVVVNPQNKEAIENELIRLKAEHTIVVNEHPEKGNGLSFILGLEEVKTERFILTMGDHIYEEAFVKDAVKKEGLIVDQEGRFIDRSEATKVKVEEGKVTEIGKDLKDYHGFDTGFFVLKSEFFSENREIIKKLKERERIEMKDVVEALSFKASFVSGRFWMDIDSPLDYEKATRTLLALSVKNSEDGLVARYINRKISLKISEKLINRIEPFHATLASALIGIISALTALFSPKGGMLLYQISSILDGVDGEIARASLKTSALGGWLDSVLDRIVDFLVLCALALHLEAAKTNVLLAMWALFSFFMVSYIAERYKGATSKSIYADYPQIKKIPGKRDERIFLLMLLVFLTDVKTAILLLALITTIRISYTLMTVGRHIITGLLAIFLISSVALGSDCLFLFRPEFKAYISRQIKAKDRIMVTIHGGLSSAEKSYSMCNRFSEKFPDFVVVSLDFSPSAIGTREIAEAVKLINWLKSQNPSRIGIIGKSYGGYIALMSAAQTDADFVVSIAAPTEMKSMFSFVKAHPDRFKKWQKAIEASQLLCRKRNLQEDVCLSQISPVNFVSKLNEKLLIIHGTKDETVPLQQALRLIEALTESHKTGFEAFIYEKDHNIDPLEGKAYNIIKDFIYPEGRDGMP